MKRDVHSFREASRTERCARVASKTTGIFSIISLVVVLAGIALLFGVLSQASWNGIEIPLEQDWAEIIIISGVTGEVLFAPAWAVARNYRNYDSQMSQKKSEKALHNLKKYEYKKMKKANKKVSKKLGN